MNKAEYINQLLNLVDELMQAADLYGKKGTLENTYLNGQNDGRALAYIDSFNRIKLLVKKSRLKRN